MNFKSFKQSLTLYKVVMISFLLLIGVGLGVWWQNLRPGSRPETLPPLPRLEVFSMIPQPNLGNISLRAGKASSATTAPVYQYYVADGVPQEKAKSWAEALGFAGEPEEATDSARGKFYLWTHGGRMLMVDSQAMSLSFAVDLLADPQVLEGSFLPTFEQAAAIVERTLSELSINSHILKIDNKKSQYLKAGVARAQKATVAEADLVEVHFSATIEDQPVVSAVGPGVDPVVAWVGKDGKLLRLELQVVGSLGEKVGDYPLKSLEEVKEDLEGGEGVVINSTLEGGQETVSTTITQVSLGYLLPQTNAQIIQPIYILKGQSRTTAGVSGEIVIYLDALK